MTTDDPLAPVLDEKTSVDGVTNRILEWFGFAHSDPFAERIKGETPMLLQPLLEQMQDGDELWICRSRKIGPLYGHRGVALVRDGKIVEYKRMINH